MRLWVHRARSLGRDPGQPVPAPFRGLPLVVDPGVFHPLHAGSSAFMAEVACAELPRGARVLDLGTGSGALGLAALRSGAGKVVSTDVAPAAVACARANARRCGLEDGIEVREGTLFEPVRGERFDRIWWNPPYYPREPGSPAAAAFMSGEGHGVVARFLSEYESFLRPGGLALLVLSDDSDLPAFVRGGLPLGHGHRIVATRRAWAETFTVVALTPSQGR